MNLSAAVTLWLILLAAHDPAKVATDTASISMNEAAQTPAAAAQAFEPAIDPAKEASIRKLLEVTGTGKLVLQTVGNMKDTIRPLVLSSLPVGEYRERLVDLFFERFQTKLTPASLLEITVPIYAKYFSRDEIEGLIQFYQTPLGQKAISVLPQVMGEAQLAGKKLGEKFGRESMMEVLQEHPDLRKAVEEAATAAKKQ